MHFLAFLLIAFIWSMYLAAEEKRRKPAPPSPPTVVVVAALFQPPQPPDLSAGVIYPADFASRSSSRGSGASGAYSSSGTYPPRLLAPPESHTLGSLPEHESDHIAMPLPRWARGAARL